MKDTREKMLKEVEDGIQQSVDFLRQVRMHLEQNNEAEACVKMSFLRRAAGRVHAYADDLVDDLLPFKR